MQCSDPLISSTPSQNVQQAATDYATAQTRVNAIYEDAIIKQQTAENQTQAAEQLETTANEVTLEQLNGKQPRYNRPYSL